MTHDWQPIEGGFACSRCFRRSLRGTSQGECVPRSSAPNGARVVAMPQPVARDDRLIARATGVPCSHRGQVATIEGIAIVRKCGCASSQQFAKLYQCDLHTCLCQTRGTSLAGEIDGQKVRVQARCVDYVPTPDEPEAFVPADEVERLGLRRVKAAPGTT